MTEQREVEEILRNIAKLIAIVKPPETEAEPPPVPDTPNVLTCPGCSSEVAPDDGPPIVHGIVGSYIRLDKIELLELSQSLWVAANATDHYGISHNLAARKEANSLRRWALLFEQVATVMVSQTHLSGDILDPDPELHFREAITEMNRIDKFVMGHAHEKVVFVEEERYGKMVEQGANQ